VFALALKESSLEKSLQQPPVFGVRKQEERTKRGSESLVLTAGGLAALLAGACCLGPFVLVSIGLGGAWLSNFQLLEPYRPFLIAISVAALAFAGWRIYRPQAACEPGTACAIPAVRKGYKIGFWIVAALLLTSLTFPYYASLFY
jgi:mercuric ion transport protein